MAAVFKFFLFFLIHGIVCQENATFPDETTNEGTTPEAVTSDEQTTVTETVTQDAGTTTENVTPDAETTTETVTSDVETTTETVTSDAETTAKTTVTPDAGTTTEVVTTNAGTTTEAVTTDPPPDKIYLGDLQSWNWTSDGYPTNDMSVHVSLGDEYDKGILVVIYYVDLDGTNQDFLLIKSGTNLIDDDDKDPEGNIFANSVKGPRKLYFDTRDVFAYFRKNDTSPSSDTLKGFSVGFERVNDLMTTTTVTTTTENNFPTPAVEDSTNFTALVSGASWKQYTEESLQNKFKAAVVGMATQYCYEHDMFLKESITNSNVLIQKVVQCPYVWPDSDKCAEVTFEVPVVLTDTVSDSVKGYQLKTEHLERMWNTLAEQYLPADITIYVEPATDGIIFWWIICVTCTTIGFIVMLWLTRFICSKSSKLTRRRKLSDTGTIVDDADGNSLDSFDQHYYQDIPPIFENAYPLYKP